MTGWREVQYVWWWGSGCRQSAQYMGREKRGVGRVNWGGGGGRWGYSRLGGVTCMYGIGIGGSLG